MLLEVKPSTSDCALRTVRRERRFQLQTKLPNTTVAFATSTAAAAATATGNDMEGERARGRGGPEVTVAGHHLAARQRATCDSGKVQLQGALSPRTQLAFVL